MAINNNTAFRIDGRDGRWVKTNTGIAQLGDNAGLSDVYRDQGKDVTYSQADVDGTFSNMMDIGSNRYGGQFTNETTGQTVQSNQIASVLGRQPIGSLPTRSQELAGNTQGLTSGSAISSQLGAVGSVQGGNVGNSNNYLSQLQALQGQSSEEQSAEKALQDQQNQFRTGMQNVQDQPIGMQFIAGQQSSLENRNVNLQIPLQQRLANAQAKRQAAIDSAKIGLDQSNADRAFNYNKSSDARSRTDRLSAQQLDENYRRDVLNKPSDNTEAGFTLNEGDKRFDAQGNLIASGGAKTYAPRGGGGTPTTTQQKSLLTKTLNTGLSPSGAKIGNARGPDGYVDPGVYLQAFQQWTGTPSQFLTAFPVKTNVNPASYSLLPAALQTSVTSRGA